MIRRRRPTYFGLYEANPYDPCPVEVQIEIVTHRLDVARAHLIAIVTPEIEFYPAQDAQPARPVPPGAMMTSTLDLVGSGPPMLPATPARAPRVVFDGDASIIEFRDIHGRVSHLAVSGATEAVFEWGPWEDVER